MAEGTVYIIKDDFIVDQWDMEFAEAIHQYFGQYNPRGVYYIAGKGVKIPYQKKNQALKDVRPQSDHQE